MPILQDSMQNAQAGVPAPAATAATAPQNIPGAPAGGGQQLPPPNPAVNDEQDVRDNQGNGTIPKDVLVPVGVTLMFEAADYLFEVGMEVTEGDLSDSMELMVYSIFEAYGVPQAEVDKIIDKLMSDLDLDDETKEKLVGGVKEREAEDMEAAEAETAAQETAEGPAGEEAEFNASFDAEQAKRRM